MRQWDYNHLETNKPFPPSPSKPRNMFKKKLINKIQFRHLIAAASNKKSLSSTKIIIPCGWGQSSSEIQYD